MSNKPFDQLDIVECDQLIMHYVCAQCWGSLQFGLNKNSKVKKYKVYCPKCGEDRGFVTRKFADKKRVESRLEAIEAKRNIGNLLGIEEEQIDRDQAINMLCPK